MSDGNIKTAEFNEVRSAELDRLKKRRKLARQPKGNPSNDAVGLALSGGGIRSATFNLGLLQAMEDAKILKSIDYLSTVSGGGYIGSSLTWFMSKLKRPFPFGTQRKDHQKIGGKVLYWLRAHGNYLMPGDGITLWAMISAIFTGIMINLIVMVPIFVLALWILSIRFDVAPPFFESLTFLFNGTLEEILLNLIDSGFAWLITLGIFLIGIFFLFALFFAFSTRFNCFRNFINQRSLRQIAGKVLMYSVLLMLVGSIPIVHDILMNTKDYLIDMAISSFSLSGIISILGALRGRKGGNEAKGARSFFLSVGLSLLAYGLFLWFYHPFYEGAYFLGWLQYALPLSILLAFIADINHVSMHRFYRNRLMESYFPYEIAGVDIKEADVCLLKDIEQTAAPYHIICCNMVTLGSEYAKLRGRGGDSFIFSPLYCGADSTNYMRTDNYIGGNMNLATAFAISGAAVNPNTYITRSRPLNFLMSFLNIRLGYWIRNPRYTSPGGSIFRTMWYYYMFMEMFGKGLNEERRQIHLSDGGHFENLGLYELIRRRCGSIIVVDAGADSNWKFGDLARCIEMIRLDFGAKVDLNTEPLMPDSSNKISPQAYVKGKVTYDNGKTADLIYIKTALVKNLPEDIYFYQRINPTFPDETTADQFFDERQFEAYRELGFRIGEKLFKGAKGKDLKSWIHKLKSC